jgi:hypothetical protein
MGEIVYLYYPISLKKINMYFFLLINIYLFQVKPGPSSSRNVASDVAQPVINNPLNHNAGGHHQVHGDPFIAEKVPFETQEYVIHAQSFISITESYANDLLLYFAM